MKHIHLVLNIKTAIQTHLCELKRTISYRKAIKCSNSKRENLVLVITQS